MKKRNLMYLGMALIILISPFLTILPGKALETPVVTCADSFEVGEDFTIQIAPVEGGYSYRAILRNNTNNIPYWLDFEMRSYTATLSGQDNISPGEYTLTVYCSSFFGDESEPFNKSITVTGERPLCPKITTEKDAYSPYEKIGILFDTPNVEDAVLNWKNEKTQSYDSHSWWWVSSNKIILEPMQRPTPLGMYSLEASVKINGRWTKYSEPVKVLIWTGEATPTDLSAFEHKHEWETWEGITATCTEPGMTKEKYCIYCGEVEIESKEIPKLGHDWEAPFYAWSDDYSKAIATRTCKRDENHYEREIVNTTVETTPATCDTEGMNVYTAEFKNPDFAKQTHTVKIPRLGTAPASITLSKTKLSISGIKEQTITATLTNPEDSITEVKSSNTKIAKVKVSGNDIKVSSVKQEGDAVIIVSTKYGATAAITVTVKSGAVLNEKSITLKPKKTFKIKVLSIPATIKAKSFSSNKPTVATVDKKGKIKAVGKGSATITVTLTNGKKLKLKVKVK